MERNPTPSCTLPAPTCCTGPWQTTRSTILYRSRHVQRHGFLTKDNMPLPSIHGQGSARTKSPRQGPQLSAWEKPYPVEPRTPTARTSNAPLGHPMLPHWATLIYAMSGGDIPRSFKSKDLKNWTYVGGFPAGVILRRGLWRRHLLSTSLRSATNGCCSASATLLLSAITSDWDAKAEQFVPEKHGRMNWRRDDQSLSSTRDFLRSGKRASRGWPPCHVGLVRHPQQRPNSKTSIAPARTELPGRWWLRIEPLRELDRSVTAGHADDIQFGSEAALRTHPELDGDSF